MALFDLKVIDSVLDQLEEERGVPKEAVLEAIEAALATAYKKEYGKRGQIIRANFDPESGDVEFEQVKIVVDDSIVRLPEEEEEMSDEEKKEDDRSRFNPEQHILIENARRMKKGVELEEEVSFPLQDKGDYGRISAQTAKQVIIQKIREAERASVTAEYGDREGEIVSGTIQRQERGTIFVDLGRATGILPYNEQIPGERFKQGERIRAYLKSVDDKGKGVYLRLSRSCPEFLEELFSIEAPEVANGTVEIKAIAREAGARSKVAASSNDEYIDPVGSLVGQRGVRVMTVSSELGNEKIDIIEYSDVPERFVEEALSPAEVLSVDIDEATRTAHVLVAPDQQSLAIGKGGQNARLAAKLTGLKIDIASMGEESSEEVDEKQAEETAPTTPTDEDVEASVEDLSETVSKEDEDNEPADIDEAAKEEALGEDLAKEGLDDSPVEEIDNTERMEREDAEGEAIESKAPGEQIEEAAEEMMGDENEYEEGADKIEETEKASQEEEEEE